MRLLVLLITFALTAINPQLVSSQQKVKVIDRPTIIVKPFCNPEGEAAGYLM